MKKVYASPVIRVVSVKQSVICTSNVTTGSHVVIPGVNDYIGGWASGSGWGSTDDPD